VRAFRELHITPPFTKNLPALAELKLRPTSDRDINRWSIVINSKLIRQTAWLMKARYHWRNSFSPSATFCCPPLVLPVDDPSIDQLPTPGMNLDFSPS
jgi:hypothetical protein